MSSYAETHRPSVRFNTYPPNYLKKGNCNRDIYKCLETVARREKRILAENPPYTAQVSKCPKWIKSIMNFFSKHHVK